MVLPPRILVVEDEEEVRKVICLTLSLQGFEALPAASAEAALELARHTSGRIDMLLTDVVLPESSGPELALKIYESWPDLRVLYISGYAEEQLQLHGLSSSEPFFLAKPFSSMALTNKVREMLR